MQTDWKDATSATNIYLQKKFHLGGCPSIKPRLSGGGVKDFVTLILKCQKRDRGQELCKMGGFHCAGPAGTGKKKKVTENSPLLTF